MRNKAIILSILVVLSILIVWLVIQFLPHPVVYDSESVWSFHVTYYGDDMSKTEPEVYLTEDDFDVDGMKELLSSLSCRRVYRPSLSTDGVLFQIQFHADGNVPHRLIVGADNFVYTTPDNWQFFRILHSEDLVERVYALMDKQALQDEIQCDPPRKAQGASLRPIVRLADWSFGIVRSR